MPVILDVKELGVSTVGLSRQLLIDQVSFRLNKGEILGIVGESGSGKSLTALSILSLLPENVTMITGKILLNDGDEIIDLPSLSNQDMRKYRGRKIAMIFQEPMSSLNPSMRCGRQVEEGITAHFQMSHRERKVKVLNLFAEVNFQNPKEIYRSYPHQLSGGQRQRVMIAMALGADPDIIIADEPTTALDVTVQKNIIDILKRLRKTRSLSVIFISHDLRLISEIADNAVVMRKGKVVEQGTVHEIFKMAKDPYTKGLIACLPPLNNRPARLLTIQDIEKGKVHYPIAEVHQFPGIQPEDIPLLQIKNLSVTYSHPGLIFTSSAKAVRAVKQVTFDVRKGETLGLVGESGCGKTTIGKTILRLVHHQEGEIWYKGQKIGSLKKKELRSFRKNVQVVFQDPYSSLNPKQTIFEMLNESIKFHFPLLNRKERFERITDLLDKVGLTGKDMFKYPHQFSGGERQRICIARSLTPEPEFLVLDEAVASLDVSVQAQILNLLNDLKEFYGLTYIFISHDMAVVKYMSNRMIVMHDGEIEETGNPDDLFKFPSSDYTRKLIDSIPGYQNSI